MGQIVGGAAKPKRCNLSKLSQLGTPAAGEHILVSSDNSMNAAGQGYFDCYVVGDGYTAAVELELHYISDAQNVFFNKDTSGVNSENVQDAIDELYLMSEGGSVTYNTTLYESDIVLLDDGTTSSLNNFYTSDYISLKNVVSIATSGLLNMTSGYAGLLFFNAEKNLIYSPLCFGSIPTSIDMSNYEEAKYLRFCGKSDAYITLTISNSVTDNEIIESEESTITKIYNSSYAVKQGNVLKQDGGVTTGNSTYSITSHINISGVSRITTTGLFSGSVYAGVVLFADDMSTVIQYINGTSDVTITDSSVTYMRAMFTTGSTTQEIVVYLDGVKYYIDSDNIKVGDTTLTDKIEEIDSTINELESLSYTGSDATISGVLDYDGNIVTLGSWKYQTITIPQGYNKVTFSGLYGVQNNYSGGGIFNSSDELLTHLNVYGDILLDAYDDASYIILCYHSSYTASASLTLSTYSPSEFTYVYNPTGTKLRLAADINNNVIFKNANYKNVVILGNSLTWHEYNTSLDWYGTNRSMASTTPQVSWPYQLQRILANREDDASVVGVMCRLWERAGDGNRTPSVIQDLLDAALSEDVDLIIFRTGENAIVSNVNTFASEIESLIDYCLSIATTADVVMTSCFWHNTNKDSAIEQVATERNYPYITTGARFSYHKEIKGDFMIDDTDDSEKMLDNSSVIAHTNDVGFYMFCDYLASVLGYKEELLGEMHNITISSTLTNGYTIKETKAQRYALVTILVSESSEPSISVVDGDGNAVTTSVHTISVDDYTFAFTFIQPNSDVEVTLS